MPISRTYTAPVGESSNFSRLNMAQEVDSVADVQKFATEQFSHGGQPAEVHAIRWRGVGLRSVAACRRVTG